MTKLKQKLKMKKAKRNERRCVGHGGFKERGIELISKEDSILSIPLNFENDVHNYINNEEKSIV